MTHIGSLLLDARHSDGHRNGCGIPISYSSRLSRSVYVPCDTARGTRGCCNAQEKSKSSTSH